MTALVILAAGSSVRMGQPKQNLIFNNKTLLQHTVETALQTACKPVIIITGAHTKKIVPVVKDERVMFMHNAGWQEGMASSIRLAVAEIIKDKVLKNVVMMLCDQPFVTPQLINGLIQRQSETGKSIVACQYQETKGVPALFNRKIFSQLLLLKGQEGAKTILQKNADDIAVIPFEEGSVDIDTPEDYEKLLHHK